MTAQVDVDEDRVVLQGIECREADVVAFFGDAAPETRVELAGRAVAIGVAGLRAMGVAGHVELVEREFAKLSHQFDRALATTEGQLLERVHSTFDPDHAESVSARLAASVADAHGAAGKVITETRSQLERLIQDSFNPDLATSCVYRIAKLVTDTRAELDRAFDPTFKGSHLSHLVELVDSYFGEGGAVEAQVAAQVGPVKDELMAALQGLRELVVGQAMAADERDRSPASGFDFEDEVEAVLCRLAAVHGDTVDCVGTTAGDAGRSKRGDFAVQLPDGRRFVVEAKKRSTPLPLRGDRGVLAMLDDSMINRGASFAIAVARDASAFAKEVGSFNEYDDNKLLCRFGETGELLEAAYRWARARLLMVAAEEAGIDVDSIENGVEEARRAVHELSRIEAKAKAIAHGADEIQSLVSFQIRRLNTALDQAAAGLEYRSTRVAS
ncbi:MAG: hypothetical protein M0T80_01065 [Actinomycetota bacterium]|jgi:hypothetical protein|nr:hypothetical protein [Actinomycetota bacterium]MDA8071659.1 hypothetical protein [Actinomycetota bacterium]